MPPKSTFFETPLFVATCQLQSAVDAGFLLCYRYLVTSGGLSMIDWIAKSIFGLAIFFLALSLLSFTFEKSMNSNRLNRGPVRTCKEDDDKLISRCLLQSHISDFPNKSSKNPKNRTTSTIVYTLWGLSFRRDFEETHSLHLKKISSTVSHSNANKVEQEMWHILCWHVEALPDAGMTRKTHI